MSNVDILLRNVKMQIPANGIDCDFNPHGICLVTKNVCSSVKGRPENCPIRVLGTHGDLMDKDILLRERFNPNNWTYDMTDLDWYLAELPVAAYSNKDF